MDLSLLQYSCAGSFAIVSVNAAVFFRLRAAKVRQQWCVIIFAMNANISLLNSFNALHQELQNDYAWKFSAVRKIRRKKSFTRGLMNNMTIDCKVQS